ncbi:MAG: hypothetical protein SFV53_00825 [Rickettsiales bacterium]|nr:hypothetical protein [Rickettsiales bacterium]
MAKKKSDWLKEFLSNLGDVLSNEENLSNPAEENLIADPEVFIESLLLSILMFRNGLFRKA